MQSLDIWVDGQTGEPEFYIVEQGYLKEQQQMEMSEWGVVMMEHF